MIYSNWVERSVFCTEKYYYFKSELEYRGRVLFCCAVGAPKRRNLKLLFVTLKKFIILYSKFYLLAILSWFVLQNVIKPIQSQIEGSVLTMSSFCECIYREYPAIFATPSAQVTSPAILSSVFTSLCDKPDHCVRQKRTIPSTMGKTKFSVISLYIVFRNYDRYSIFDNFML